jgi:hypothetical protein
MKKQQKKRCFKEKFGTHVYNLSLYRSETGGSNDFSQFSNNNNRGSNELVNVIVVMRDGNKIVVTIE